MLNRAHLGAPRDSSPGLLHRRYSVPETIMRKYSLAQQQSELDSNAPRNSDSPVSASPVRGSCSSPSESPRREYLRRATLIRRARACCGRETRSLDNSRCELRNLSSSLTSSRYSNIGVGWLSPKRQRLESPHDTRGSDEILRIAMKNSYERSEESRNGKTSDCTYNSHNQQISPYTSTDVLIDSYISESGCRSKRDVFAKYSELYSDSNLVPLKIDCVQSATVDSESMLLATTDDPSFTDTSDTFSTSMPTTKEVMEIHECNRLKNLSKNNQIAGRISERETSAENDAQNVDSYDKLVTKDTPSYEVLEVIVSETFNKSAPNTPLSNITTDPQTTTCNINMQNVDIDEYVSSILLESLNSLTDQLEYMSASIGPDNKISIIEKEIKVKLHNTGVNTIVHLSPTSNNQIIFGNKELYNNEELIKNNERDKIGNVYINSNSRKDIPIVETNNNFASVDTNHKDSSVCTSNSYHFETKNSQGDNVNKIVLQKIQKLFQDKFHNSNPNMVYPVGEIPNISHIEMSDVDMFIDNNRDLALGLSEGIEMQTNSYSKETDLIGGVKTGNYYHHADDNVIVPRFSALPNTDSMEVNTSSSEDAELINSECTSLVDSLDDPNSPRSVLMRRSLNNLKRCELVRSSIDVLDLLPESVSNHEKQQKEKGESFFIQISDSGKDCGIENLKVADRMPDKIKQRLYCRHRKRELRMECARRSKAKLMKRAAEKQKCGNLYKANKEVEKECLTLVNSLIEDMISKIISEEYKYVTIKNKCNKSNVVQPHDDNSKKLIKKDVEFLNSKEKRSIKDKNQNTKPFYSKKSSRKLEDNQNQKFSSQKHSTIGLGYELGPKRIYQKSEIFDGSKCVEILEILEYVETTQSSPETSNSDDSQNQYIKVKKSRIPIPVFDGAAKNNFHGRSATMQRLEGNGYPYQINHLNSGHSDDNDSDNNCNYVRLINGSPEITQRRASVPYLEPRARSNSLRFRRVFDIIPEEKSSLSVESSNEDINYNRRVSAPNLSKDFCVKLKQTDNSVSILKRGAVSNYTKKFTHKKQDLFDVTSPISKDPHEIKTQKSKYINKTTMTSPKSKSAATSPIGSPNAGSRCAEGGRRGLVSRPRAWLGFCQPAPSQAPQPVPSPPRDNEGIVLACAPCR